MIRFTVKKRVVRRDEIDEHVNLSGPSSCGQQLAIRLVGLKPESKHPFSQTICDKRSLVVTKRDAAVRADKAREHLKQAR